jgi:NADH dehydrogenase FAD-containing subunit
MPANESLFHVVILGAGYAGQLAAARLAHKRLPVRVTVVDPSPVFVERIRLHQLAAGQSLRPRPMRSLLPRGVAWVQARAERIDTAERLVHLGGGAPALRYDALLYALGSSDDLDAVPGARRFAHGLGSLDAARAVAERVPALAAARGRVVVVGGGLTGIEAAAELAETYPGLEVTLVTAGQLGSGLHENGRAHLVEVFGRLGVRVREHAAVAAVEDGSVRLADGAGLAFDLCLWSAGFRAPALARRSGLPVDGRDRVEVDGTLRARGHDVVFAAGDAAVVPSFGVDGAPPLRMACATAMPMGIHAAEEIARMVRAEPRQAFRFAFAGQCISLGRRDGLVQMVDAGDRPLPRIRRGRTAMRIKELICRYTIWMIRAERLGLALYRWPAPRAERYPLAAPSEERA